MQEWSGEVCGCPGEGWGPSAVPLSDWGELRALPHWLGSLVPVLCAKDSVLCVTLPIFLRSVQAAVPRGHSSAPQLCQCPLGLLEEITEMQKEKLLMPSLFPFSSQLAFI